VGRVFFAGTESISANTGARRRHVRRPDPPQVQRTKNSSRKTVEGNGGEKFRIKETGVKYFFALLAKHLETTALSKVNLFIDICRDSFKQFEIKMI